MPEREPDPAYVAMIDRVWAKRQAEKAQEQAEASANNVAKHSPAAEANTHAQNGFAATNQAKAGASPTNPPVAVAISAEDQAKAEWRKMETSNRQRWSSESRYVQTRCAELDGRFRTTAQPTK